MSNYKFGYPRDEKRRTIELINPPWSPFLEEAGNYIELTGKGEFWLVPYSHGSLFSMSCCHLQNLLPREMVDEESISEPCRRVRPTHWTSCTWRLFGQDGYSNMYVPILQRPIHWILKASCVMHTAQGVCHGLSKFLFSSNSDVGSLNQYPFSFSIALQIYSAPRVIFFQLPLTDRWPTQDYLMKFFMERPKDRNPWVSSCLGSVALSLTCITWPFYSFSISSPSTDCPS